MSESGDILHMPYWNMSQEQQLLEMVEEGKDLEEIAKVFKRSREAVRLKISRLGLAVPEKNKVTIGSTTTPKLEPLKFEELPSPNEALGLLWAAVKRLQDPNVGREEAKKLRLILSGVKSYIHLEADYVFRTREVERRMLVMFKTELAHMKVFVEHAQDPAEKERWQQECARLEKEIAGMEAMGITEDKKQPGRRPQGVSS
jgi:hypothetical protein